MEEEATELRDRAAAAESRSGDPVPPGHDVPDDLDCLLCQVLGSPGHPGAEPTPVALAASGEVLAPDDAPPHRADLRFPGQARAPPSA